MASVKSFRLSIRTAQLENHMGRQMIITKLCDPDAQAYDVSVCGPSELHSFVLDKVKAFTASGKSCVVNILYAPRQRQRDDYNAIIGQWGQVVWDTAQLQS